MFRLIAALCALFFATAAVAQGNYAIQPGDTLRVEVIEDASLNRDLLVTPDGRISFPFAGSVRASGRTTTQLERALATQLAENFANRPTVYVAIRGLAEGNDATTGDEITVFLMGEVNAPGPKLMEEGTSLLQFLATSGGFSNFAATKRIQLRRISGSGAERIVTLNYHAISRGAVMQNNVILQDGDVVLVPERRLFE